VGVAAVDRLDIRRWKYTFRGVYRASFLDWRSLFRGSKKRLPKQFNFWCTQEVTTSATNSASR